jgi:hypothetical protein
MRGFAIRAQGAAIPAFVIAAFAIPAFVIPAQAGIQRT